MAKELLKGELSFPGCGLRSTGRYFPVVPFFGQPEKQETMPRVGGGSTPLLWQVGKCCSNLLALLDFTFLVSFLALCSVVWLVFFHHSLCSYICCSYCPTQDTIVKTKKKDKVRTGVLCLETRVLPLEDSVVLAYPSISANSGRHSRG